MSQFMELYEVVPLPLWQPFAKVLEIKYHTSFPVVKIYDHVSKGYLQFSTIAKNIYLIYSLD